MDQDSKNIKNHINNGEKKRNSRPQKNNQIFRKTNNTLIGSNNLCLNNEKSLQKI